MPREKPIAFRPTQAQKSFIESYVGGHPEIKKPSQAVVDIVFNKFPNMLAKLNELQAQKTLPKHKKSSILPSIRYMEVSKYIEKEVKRMMRGQDSPYIEAILNMTPRSCARSITLATKTGIIMLIPSNNP